MMGKLQWDALEGVRIGCQVLNFRLFSLQFPNFFLIRKAVKFTIEVQHETGVILWRDCYFEALFSCLTSGLKFICPNQKGSTVCEALVRL